MYLEVHAIETLQVLIVDDEVAMGLAVERALRNYTVRLPEVDIEVGFESTRLETGEEALKAIESTPPDILLLDHKLPGMSGLDVLSHLAAKEHDLLIIMITAYASLENAISATKSGAYDFLAKPFTPEELKSSVYKTAKHLMLQRQARKLAQEKHKIRFQFISVLAHELKAPLAAIEQYLRILDSNQADDDASIEKKMIGRSLDRIQGMRKLILDLLDLTRIESGQKKREIVPLDIVEIANASIETVAEQARERGIIVHLDSPASVTMKADRWEMEVILNNLVTNAVKYNKEEGKVEITLGSKADSVSIAVADTGIGISKEDAARLFNEFVRIKSEETEQIMGSGLGLSIVKKIVSVYGGSVSLESEPDKGSTFTVILPKAQNTDKKSQLC